MATPGYGGPWLWRAVTVRTVDVRCFLRLTSDVVGVVVVFGVGSVRPVFYSILGSLVTWAAHSPELHLTCIVNSSFNHLLELIAKYLKLHFATAVATPYQ